MSRIRGLDLVVLLSVASSLSWRPASAGPGQVHLKTDATAISSQRLIDAVKAGNRASVGALLKQSPGVNDVNAREADGTTDRKSVV